uniref:Ladderlectin-like n=1 Tax=Salmo trutta TaxID=8032 RepID=A0A674APG7_SALTR
MEKLAILLLLSAAIALGDANLTLLLGLEPLLKTEGTKESSCPSDWHTYGSRCFKFVSIPQSWADSEQNCLALGGNLASVRNLLEYQFMQALTKDTNGHLPDTWVGGFDAVKEGLWMWSDGTRFDYTHWNTEECRLGNDPATSTPTSRGQQSTLQYSNQDLSLTAAHQHDK